MCIQDINLFVKYKWSILNFWYFDINDQTNTKVVIQKCPLKLIYIQFKFVLDNEEINDNDKDVSFYLYFA